VSADSLEDRRAEMARQFDEAFAKPRTEWSQEAEGFVGVRLDGELYALRVRELAELHAGKRIVPVPSPVREFLGVVGMRNGVVPVYCLESLLGHPRTEKAPRWLIIAASREPVAFAFAHFDGHVRLDDARALPAESKTTAHVSELLHASDGIRRVISVPSLVEVVRMRTSPKIAMKEH
jgi:chemotaxis signal transduction protein